jgi:hypothetical protein
MLDLKAAEVPLFDVGKLQELVANNKCTFILKLECKLLVIVHLASHRDLANAEYQTLVASIGEAL